MSIHPLLAEYARLMQRELDANADKGDWTTLDPKLKEKLVSELYYHVRKLDIAVANTPDKILEHAADVGNIAMMVAMLSGELSMTNVIDTNFDSTRTFFFRSRGLGMDQVPGCFVCGGSLFGHVDNISGYVVSKTDGELIVANIFGPTRARLDWRAYEPNYIQVKFGTCAKHKPNLVHLHALLQPEKISREIVEVAKQFGQTLQAKD